MSTLCSAEEVRSAKFSAKAKGEAGPEMAAVAETIIERRSVRREPANFRDRYQNALRELVEPNQRTGENAARDGRTAEGHQSDGSLEAQRCAGRRARSEAPTSRPTRAKVFPTDVKELLPVSGGNGKTDAAVAELAASMASKRCKNAE